MKEITKIVLTGGPCAGKTSALKLIVNHFTTLGFKVFTIPEIPTIFIHSGMNYLTDNLDYFYEGEKATLEIQLAFEDKFFRMAQSYKKKKCIIICDRGAMDISAYMKPGMWEEVTQLLNTSTEQIKQRYDAVIHLSTVAKGAEHFYTTATNAERLEQADEKGLEIARLLDEKIINAWKGHPHQSIIGNYDTFNQKADLVIKEISNLLCIK